MPNTHEALNTQRQKRFLKRLLENGGFVERAIRECHTSRTWLNQQLEDDETFTALFQAIRDQNNEKIEEEIYRRAVTGNKKPKFDKGVPTGHFELEYSDNLLMFLAKANMPGKYRDLPQKDHPISDEELNERIAKYMNARNRAPKELQTSDVVN